MRSVSRSVMMAGWLLLATILASARATAAITEKTASDVADTITSQVTAKLNCGGDELSYPPGAAKYDFWLVDPCDLSIRYPYEVPVADPSGSTLLARVDRVVIQSPGEVQTIFSAPLRKSGVKVLSSSEWWASSKLQTGQRYEVRVVYRLLDVAVVGGESTEKEIDQIAVTPLRFKPVRNRWALQLTGKLFTAWQPKADGDVSFIVPGVAVGPALRYAADFNDQDVIALRLVGAAGPNLIARQEVTTDENGQVTALQPRQQLQILLGAELVLGRYISVGTVHGLLSGADEDGWLVLLSYGELYPATSTR